MKKLFSLFTVACLSTFSMAWAGPSASVQISTTSTPVYLPATSIPVVQGSSIPFTVTGVLGSSGPVNVTGSTVTIREVAGSSIPVTIQGIVPVDVRNLPASSSHTVVDNFPSTQTISGIITAEPGTGTFKIGQTTVTILNQSTHTVVDNFPSVQNVSQQGVVAVTGTVTANAGSGYYLIKWDSTSLTNQMPVDIQGQTIQLMVVSSATTSLNVVSTNTVVIGSSTTLNATVSQKESNSTWVYVSSSIALSSTLPTATSLGSGKKGKSVTVVATGGNVTYNISGGTGIVLPSGTSDLEEFMPFFIDNPTVNITALDSGATAYIRITGGQE